MKNIAVRTFMMRQVTSFLMFTGLLFCLPVTAEPLDAEPPDIRVMGLFKNKAVVRINGRQQILNVGKATPEGITLIRASSNRAVIEYNGKQRIYHIGSNVSTNMQSPDEAVVRIPSRYGMYLTQGLINGQHVNFLVDTGATDVAMSRVTADRLLLPYLQTGTPITAVTAAGTTRAWKIKLNSVTVGAIKLHNVSGSVIDTNYDQEVLLGMSFVGRVTMSQEEDGMIVLKQKK